MFSLVYIWSVFFESCQEYRCYCSMMNEEAFAVRLEGWWWLEGAGKGWINEWRVDWHLRKVHNDVHRSPPPPWLKMVLTSSWCTMANWFLCSCMSLSQVSLWGGPPVLTCIEHWVPLFAAKQMEVNRQLSFSISPQDQQPLIWKLHMARLVCVLDWCVSTNKRSCLTVSSQTRKAFLFLFWCFFFVCFFFTCHSVCRWNCCQWIRHGCGCPWTRPNLSASGFPRARWNWLSSQCWQRSRKHTTGDTDEQRDARKWGRWSQLNNHAMCVIHQPSKLRRSMCKMCVSAASPTALTVLFTTMERLHQQSIGQRALSPNPACGRKVYSKPKTVIPFWRACVVCWLKSRTEQKAERESGRSLMAPWGIVVIGPQGTWELLWVYAKGWHGCGKHAA